MKTFKEWTDTKCNLDKYLSIGDELDEEIVDYIIGCLPPRTMSENVVQLGEPYSHAFDESKGIYRATYSTFVSLDSHWFYAGKCFSGAKGMQSFISEFIGWTKGVK